MINLIFLSLFLLPISIAYHSNTSHSLYLLYLSTHEIYKQRKKKKKGEMCEKCYKKTSVGRTFLYQNSEK